MKGEAALELHIRIFEVFPVRWLLLLRFPKVALASPWTPTPCNDTRAIKERLELSDQFEHPVESTYPLEL